ncbi:hypothetical protein C8Q75DRAFT_773190 [Abortiporus biennis]|nr:hypothetical protein C8Q75DRAFT_773190 [Abortiporus biennis]
MPLAQVDDKGTQIYYEDTGIPLNAKSYSTLFIIHGGIWNGGIFQRMTQYSAGNSIRIVRLNQRNVLPSTPFTPEELQSFSTSDRVVHESFIRDRALEYVRFFCWFIEKEDLPPLDGESGGISIMSWSSGNCFTISLLAFAEWLPKKTAEFLNGYIRSFILFDAPYYVFGEPVPPVDVLYSPFEDPSLSHSERLKQFPRWNASYHSHAPEIIALYSPTTTLDSMPTREEIISSLGKVPDSIPSPTTDRIPQEQVESLKQSIGSFCPSGAPAFAIFLDREMYRSLTDHALLETSTVWPRCRVEVVVCERSLPHCVHGNLELKRRILKAEKDGVRNGARNVRFWLLEGYNHYPHWEDPEKFTKFVAGIL